MSALLPALGVVLAAVVTVIGGVFTQRQVKSLGARKENREDFQAITDRQDKEIERLNERQTSTEAKLAAAEQRELNEHRIVTVCLRFIEGLTRQLRENGVEPPPLPSELAERMYE